MFWHCFCRTVRMRWLLLSVCLCWMYTGNAQTDTLRNGDTLYYVHHFKSGEVSTLTTVLHGGRMRTGYAYAFTRDGKRIYRETIRRIAGSASVRFSYFPDGAVKKAHFISHPDGGIQRTEIITTFDQAGKVIRTDDLSDDGFGRNPFIQPSITSTPERHAKEAEIVENASLFVTDVYAINHSKKAIVLKSPESEVDRVIGTGDTLKVTTYAGRQVFGRPQDRVSIIVELQKPKRRWKITDTWETIMESKERRSVYIHLNRVRK